ncbi:MAG: type IV pilus twitching motility protein PilT, partial [Nitrospiraceae bacterium]
MSDAMQLFTELQDILGRHSAPAGGTVIKNVLIREDEPIRIETPQGLIEVNPGLVSPGSGDEIVLNSRVGYSWSRQDLTEFFGVMEPNWQDRVEDGAIDRPIAISGSRLRANLFTYNGDFSLQGQVGSSGKVGLALRVFRSNIPSIGELGLPASAVEVINSRRGMILLTGGTGAGKSTTAASMIDRVNSTRAGHVITIESPIEYTHESKGCVITQREVGPNVSSMARGVYDAMREFPIAILIGEIRETDAATAALYAGESGHLVIGTMHSNSAVGGLSKMIGFFPGSEPITAESLSQSLLGIFAQTLVPTADSRGWT